ncbi:hypothetical protein CA234_02930 [Sphingomonas sp. ABOLE]|nr:hypothetical protein CA234_02930 [Sphingomonas sp. ABOLE]
MNGIAPPPRKTLLEWIETDASDPAYDGRPSCSPKLTALHHAVVIQPTHGEAREPLTPPQGLALAPLG